MTAVDAFAGPLDAARYGEYRRSPADRTPRFAGRLGTAQWPAEPGRYHLYGGWSCPASHRLAIIRELAGLRDVVSMSYVDLFRDGRGWAFREGTGPDPVNGFTLLAQAYDASSPGYTGHVTVPVLWDRDAASIVSTAPVPIGIDLATAFGGEGAIRTAADAAAIDAVSHRIAAEVDGRIAAAVYRTSDAETLRRTLAGFDAVLADQPFLVAGHLTDADVRLWVQLVRYDAGPNAHGAVGPRLDAFVHLWRWARRLYALPAFRDTTDFARFSAPLADLPPWEDAA